MKIRSDFVTNSSSSSFIVHRRAELISDDGKTEIYFDSTKVEGGKSNDDYDAPLFEKFAKEQYFNTGKKLKPANMASSEKLVKEYAAFLHEKNPDKYSFAGAVSMTKEESRRELGDSCGNALENFWSDSKDCFHPQLRSLIGNRWSLFDYYQDICFLHYTPCFAEKKHGKIKYNYVRFYYDDPKTGIQVDDTERFFRMIYEYFNKPELDIEEMAPRLIGCGLSQDDITSIKEMGCKVIYCSNSTGRYSKGNSIILINPESEEVIAKPVYEYFAKA